MLFLLITASAPADAETADTRQVTLQVLLQTALSSNPEIKAAEARTRAMMERPIQEGTLPDPSVGTRYHNEQFGRLTFGSSDFSYLEFSGEQDVPFPGKLRLKSSIAKREAERERAMRDLAVCSVLARVVAAYAELGVADRSTAILNEYSGVLSTIIKQANQRYSVGSGSQQDVLRATLERDGLSERIEMIAQQRTVAEAQLNALLGREANVPIGQTEWSDRIGDLPTLDILTSRVELQAPELRAAALEIARSEDSAALARRGYLPDFTVMGAYADKNGLFPEWEVGLKMTVPLYFWRRQKHAVAEADFNKSAAEHVRHGAQLTLESRVRELHRMAATAQKLVNLYGETLIPEATLTLRSAQASYSVGKSDFLTVLNVFNAILEYRLRYTENVGQFRRAMAEIGPLLGETPPELRSGGQTP